MSGSDKAPPIPSNELIHIGFRKRLASSLLYLAAIALRLLNSFRRSNPRRVLVLEPVGLGDMVGFIPLVRELLAKSYEVIICSKPEWRPLYPDRPGQTWLDVRIPWASHNEKVKYKLSLYFTDPTRNDLRSMRAAASGAIGVDTRGDIRSVLLLYWAGCKRVISLSNYLGSDLPMWRSAAEIVPFDNTIRRWELNAKFLAAIDPSFSVEGVLPPRAEHLIHKVENRTVGLVPVAPWAGKLWLPERWAAVVEHLRTAGLEPLVLCGPNQSSKAREQIRSDVAVTECGSIPEWATQFNRCSFVISVDSGPMHLADALDVPVIALYGQGKLPLWAPSGKHSTVIAHQNTPDFYVCHPIEQNTHLGRKFMERITVQEVIEAAEKVRQSVIGSTAKGTLTS